MKRPHSENCDTSHAEFILSRMEAAARAGDANKASCNIAGKWLSVFIRDDGSMAYGWQGGYPSWVVSREVALSVLVCR
jgi:hypothetical protein